MTFPRLRHEVVVDWIEIEIHTAQTTNFQTVQRVIREIERLPVGTSDAKKFVDAQDERDGRAASIFRFRIQNPERFHHVNALVQELAGRFALVDTPRLTAIEVAFDTYSHGAIKRQLAEIATDRYRFSSAVPFQDWHFYRKAGETRYIDRKGGADGMIRREIVRSFEDGYQLADTGDKKADVRHHLYVKAWDNGDPIADQGEWRARDEVTLRGVALPCATLAELENIDFAKLANHFKYRRLADDLSPLSRLCAQWGGNQIGRRGEYPRRHKSIVGKYRKTSPSTFRSWVVADPLNGIVHEELRALTRRWRSERRSPVLHNRADSSEHSDAATLVNAGLSDGTLLIGVNTHYPSLDSFGRDQSNELPGSCLPDSLRSPATTAHTTDINDEAMPPAMLRMLRFMAIDDD